MCQLNIFLSFLEPNVSCGHRLYFSNVNWYTAYKVCEEENKALVLPDPDIFNFKITLGFLIKERLDASFSNFNEWNG